MNRQYFLKQDKPDCRYFMLSLAPHPSLTIPKSMDVSHLYPDIFDQGDLGSCTANAMCAELQKLLGLNVPLSRLYQYYFERSAADKKIDSGCSSRDMVMSAIKNGVSLESLWQYIISNFAIVPPTKAILEARNHKAKVGHRIKSVQDINNYIAMFMDGILLGFPVYESFESEQVAKTGIVPMPEAGEKCKGGHETLIVGYNVKSPADKKIRNSWGKDWGDEGHFYLPDTYFEKYQCDLWVVSV